MTTKPLFLDTTIQVDRVLKEQPPELLVNLNTLLAGFDYLLVCSYSRLEFKRVVIPYADRTGMSSSNSWNSRFSREFI